MKACFQLLLIAVFAANLLSGCIPRYALARISVVDDESGEPVNGVTVKCYFRKPSEFLSGPAANHYKKRAGSSHVLWFFGHGSLPEVGAWVTTPPENYYQGKGDSRLFWTISLLLPLPIWLPPYRSLQVGVLKKLNPIPMYSYRVHFPSAFEYRNARKSTHSWTETIALDCFAGDWCPPYGKGTTPDLIFQYKFEYSGIVTNRHGEPVPCYSMERIMTFSNPDDGYQKAPRGYIVPNRPANLIAPTQGYLQEHRNFNINPVNYRKYPPNEYHQGYYFRIHTVRDNNGELTGGYYGRIEGSLSTSEWIIEYILNPNPLDTNLEFNGKSMNH